mmetsp:Transcript_52197/g.114184  ORF Transcript_52197/g.114184 Transcript_52197/m.114184 type:complete len:266 (+) Transcript_52197:667-1464(+)
MVSSFVAFSVVRSSVASDMAASSSATALLSSEMSSVSLAIDASSWSISAWRVSTASVFSLRVCSFVESSVSHQPLCSASSLASSMRRTMRSLIIFFTLVKGSAATRCEARARTRLLSCVARPSRKAAMRACRGLWLELRSCARAVACTSAGRCLSPEPATASLDMMSMALLTASSSSARSFWRLSKSADFWAQRALVSSRYFSSSALSASVCALSPSASAFACSVSARVAVFLEISCSAFSMLSDSCCSICSNACCAVISSFSRS